MIRNRRMYRALTLLLIGCTMIYLVIFYEENRNITATRKQVISSKEDKKEEIVIEFLKLPQNMNITKHEPMRKMPMRPATDKPEIIILIYYKPWGTETQQPTSKSLCGDDVSCEVTYDRSYFETADAVLFHYLETANMSCVPPRSFKNQIYIWWCREVNKKQNLTQFDNVFNLTMTYRKNSGIYSPYGGVNQLLYDIYLHHKTETAEQLLAKKVPGKVAIMVTSNCQNQKRIKVSSAIIQAGLRVHRFGFCFSGKRQIGITKNSDILHKEIQKYKFYFAFENSHHCKDYISEKLWVNSFYSGAVPIVWGANKKEVEAVAPKHSFIHMDDFDNIHDFVSHIHYLSKNETAYASYLQWRKWLANPQLMEKKFVIDEDFERGRGFCSLCRLLKEEKLRDRKGVPRQTFIVRSLSDFWHGEEHSDCHTS